MRKSHWKLYLAGLVFLGFVAAIPLYLGNSGCGGGAVCNITDIASNQPDQASCDAVAKSLGCQSGTFSAATGFCDGVACPCPDTGSTH